MNRTSKVLIVDDDLIACETLASLLKSEFYELVIVHSGIDALAFAEKEKPDLVLLDVMMPEMDGFEVCTRIRNNPNLANVPIIMVTALDDRESKLRGIESGADDYISKPFDRLELRLRIRTITKLNRFRCIVEEKERIEKLFNLSPHGIVIIDQLSQIEQLNAKFSEMLGISHENCLRGNIFESFVHPDHREMFKKMMETLDHSPEQNLTLDTSLLSASGFFLPVQIIMGHFPSEFGKNYQLSIRDLTYEKKMESELNLLLKAIQQSQIMFMIMNLDLTLTFVNPQTIQKTGFSEKELLGTKFTKHYPYELNQQFHESLKNLRKDKREWKGELCCVTKSGELLRECVSISPLTDATGFITHFVKISEEITSKKE